MIDLTLLMPEFQERLKEFVLEANYENLDVDVQCAFRSVEEQNRLYSLGRTVKNPDGINAKRPLGSIVTNAKGGYSWHQYGVAADVVYRKNGKFTWNVPDSAYINLANIAQKYGLKWGGSWQGNGKALGDLDHFELVGNLTIEEALQLGTIPKVWEAIRRNL